jgi:hypothetical protein
VNQYPYSPSPYEPPTPEHFPPARWVPPDRSATVAGVLQLVMGAFMFLAGTCLGMGLSVVGMDPILADWQKQGWQLPDVPGHDPLAFVRAAMIVMIVGVVIVGAVLAALGPLVIKRRRIPIIASIVIVTGIGLMMLLSIASTLSQLGLDPTILINVAMLAYCVGTIVKQLQALKSIPNPRAVAAMQQAWYYWMQQQQYTGGYGYGPGPAGGSGYTAAPAPPIVPPEPSNLPPPPSA